MSATRETLLGCPVDRVDLAEILRRVTAAFAGEGTLSIEGLNVAKLVAARRDTALMAALHSAELVHIDGAGISLGAKLLGNPYPARRAGIDLMGDLLHQAVQQKVGVFLLGAKPEIVAQTAVNFEKAYPGLKIAGYRDGYFNEADEPAIAAQIAASGAGLLLIGISSPKKEIFLQRHMKTSGVRVAMGVGGSFDVVAGAVNRAPLWMQRSGLEWMFRLIQEPRRLARRYVETNSLFALMLLRAMLRGEGRKTMVWQDFLTRLEAAGPAATHCRHEIYFLRNKPLSVLRGLAALLRDMALLARLPSRSNASVEPSRFACVTLLGASGYGTIARANAVLPQMARALPIPHPRLTLEEPHARLLRPAMGHWVMALRAGLAMLGTRRTGIPRLLIASCVARHVLWQGAWQRFALYHPGAKQFLLHNDFDMMSSALVTALGDRAAMITLQHGIPTDEFFPTRAATQIVWGETSRAVYATQHAGRIIVDALGRGGAINEATETPEALCIASQTHTPVYGVDLTPLFQSLAVQLPEARLLLHPEELRRGHPYGFVPESQIARPPHALFSEGAPPQLVVGYCSTALMEAARAGHYVVGMEWPVKASLGAWAVGTPPARAADAAAVRALYERLRDDPQTRKNHRQQQDTWLAASIQDTAQFNQLLDGIT